MGFVGNFAGFLCLAAVPTLALPQATADSRAADIDLVALAKAGHPPRFEDVLRARFDTSDPSTFETLRTWATKLTPSERAQHYDKIGTAPDDKAMWTEKVPCWQADQKSLTRAMVVAVGQSANRTDAGRVWADAERAYAHAIAIEARKLVKAKAEAQRRPTALGKALAFREASDQAFREAQNDRPYDDVTAEAIAWRLWSKQCHADHDNNAYIKSIVAAGTWPLISRDGKAAAENAFLLVQHSDDDVDFQERVLVMIAPLVDRKEASGKTYALLFDRAALARHRLQRYGTQFTSKNGCLAAEPVEEPATLNARRAEMGLSNLHTYAKRLERAYKRKACTDLVEPQARAS